METQLTIKSIKSDTNTQLKNSIIKKKRLLIRWSDKYEQLKMLIDIIQEEYTFRVGRLYAKDNALDIEIIRFKKIKELMDLGISYNDAVDEIKDRYKKETEETKDFFDFDFPFDIKKFHEGEDDNTQIIKKLWKRLLHKFHPDLTTDRNEKEKRTEIMKTINKAYKNNDLKTLEYIEEKETIERIDNERELSTEDLELALVNIENAIIRTQQQYRDLKASEWHSWTNMTKENQNNLLSEMEKRILEDILEKEKQLGILKKHSGISQ